MARIYKPTYPKPIPVGAKIIQQDGKPYARFTNRRGKSMLAPLTKDGQGILLETRKWYVDYRDASGAPQTVPGYTDRMATDQLAARLERHAARQQEGMVDPFAEHLRRPLAEHLADYRRELEARDNEPRYVGNVISRLTALLNGCEFRFIADFSASRVMDWLADLRQKGRIRVPLEEGKGWFTPREAGKVLGIKSASVGCLVRRHRLESEGQNRARRFPRATIEALQDRICRGASVQTSTITSRISSRSAVGSLRTGAWATTHLSTWKAAMGKWTVGMIGAS
jgi:hypothetical protein